MEQPTFVISVLVLPLIFFSESSIFLVYLRIFAIDKTMRYLIWFGLFWTFLLYIVQIPIDAYYCTPRNGKTWGFENIHCDRTIPWAIVHGVVAVVLDFYIFLLPIPIVIRLQMSLKRRLSIIGVFGTAIL